MKKLFWILSAAVLLCSASSFAVPLRLHVIANSDSAADQSAKLAVRDAVLELTQSDMSDCSTLFEAKKTVWKNAGQITDAANAVLQRRGLAYKASISISDEHFPTRVYAGRRYPAGGYTAVRITLGKGEGHNWWCVLFPPLCYAAEEDTEYTSWILEFIRSLRP